MNEPAITTVDFNKIEGVLLHGDLSKLSTPEKVSYYNRVCTSLGLNPLTKPFDYIRLNGKEVLYAKRDATDQLRKIHNVSITITNRQQVEGVYVVSACAKASDGRTDESIGAVPIAGLKGEALANAFMKAETKAKRRVTLSVCGLGLLDETEVDSIASDPKPRDVLVTPLDESPATIPTTPLDAESLGEYVFPVGKAHKDKKLKDISITDLKSFVEWADSREASANGLNKSVANCRDKVRQFLSSIEE